MCFQVLLIYPGANAIPLEKLWVSTSEKNKDDKSTDVQDKIPFSRAIFIDCTWNQVKKITNDERIKGKLVIFTCDNYYYTKRYHIYNYIKLKYFRFTMCRTNSPGNFILEVSKRKTNFIFSYNRSNLLFCCCSS